MTVKDLLRRWVLKTCSPILFYIPGGKKPDDKARIIFSPVSQVDIRYFYPYPKNQDIEIPYYVVVAGKENAKPCGRLSIYETTTSGATRESLGCRYRIYKKIQETGEYIAVTKNGEDDPQEKEKLLKNQQTVYLPEGEYYFREFIASEGDKLFFETLKILIFKKGEGHEEQNDVIKDYREEDLPPEEEREKLLYIQYKNLFDNEIHETFDGFKRYSGKPGAEQVLPPDAPAEDGQYFSYYIYHEPKMLKVYIEFENNTETFQDIVDESYTKQSLIAYWGAEWTTGPVGRFRLPDGTIINEKGTLTDTTQVLSNPIHKICPKITKVMLMDENITNIVTSSKETRKEAEKFYCGLGFLVNGTEGVDVSADFGYCKCANLLYKDYAQKVWKIGNVGFGVEQYAIAYSERNINGFSHFFDDPYGNIYVQGAPGPVGSHSSDNRFNPAQDVTWGAYIVRNTTATGFGLDEKGEEKEQSTYYSNNGGTNPAQTDITYSIGNSIVEVKTTSTLAKTANYSWRKAKPGARWDPSYPQSGDITLSGGVEDKDFGGVGFASVSDCSHYATASLRYCSKMDKDTVASGYPNGWAPMMTADWVSGPSGNAYGAYWRMWCYEDDEENIIKSNTETFNMDFAPDLATPLYWFKHQQLKNNSDLHFCPDLKDLKELADQGIYAEKAFAAAIIFTRSLRSTYMEQTGKSDEYFSTPRTYDILKD